MTRDELAATGEELAHRYVETFNDRDVDAWVALFAEDARIDDPFFPEPTKGREAIGHLERSVLRAFSDMQWQQLRPAIEGLGDRNPVQRGVDAVHDGPLEMPWCVIFLPPDARFPYEVGVFWLIGPPGLITEERSYFDATGVAVQSGSRPDDEALIDEEVAHPTRTSQPVPIALVVRVLLTKGPRPRWCCITAATGPDGRLACFRFLRKLWERIVALPPDDPSASSAAEVENLLWDGHAVSEVETVNGAQVVTEPGVEGCLRGGQPEHGGGDVG